MHGRVGEMHGQRGLGTAEVETEMPRPCHALTGKKHALSEARHPDVAVKTSTRAIGHSVERELSGQRGRRDQTDQSAQTGRRGRKDLRGQRGRNGSRGQRDQ